MVVKSYNDRETLQFVPCGKCYACQCGKRGEMVLRMQHEMDDPSNLVYGRRYAYFFTLTYSDRYLPSIFDDEVTRELSAYNRCLPNAERRYEYSYVDRQHLSTFLKRVTEDFRLDFCNAERDSHNNLVCKEENSLLRYYCTAEYGHISHRAHYHGVIIFPREVHYFDVVRLFKDAWDYGKVDIQKIETKGACNYVAKHQVKECEGCELQQELAPIFSIMSTYNGGIGRVLKDDVVMKERYLKSLVTRDKSYCYYTAYQNDKAYKIAIPRYLIKAWHPQRFSDKELIDSQKDSFDNLKEFVFDNLINNFFLSEKTRDELEKVRFQFENIIECDLLNRDAVIGNETNMQVYRSMLTKICQPLIYEDMRRKEVYVNKRISQKLKKLKNEFTDDDCD